MILTCSQCGTRFQLDERRIPSRGARVRCSKCNNAFFVQPPEVEAETTLQGIVADTVVEAVPAPEPELEGEVSGEFGRTNPALSEAMEPVGDVPSDDWTFDDEPRDSLAGPQSADGSTADEGAGSLFGEAGQLGKDDPLEAMAREIHGSTAQLSAPISGPETPDVETSDAEAPDAEPQDASGVPTASTRELEGLGDPAEWDFLEDSVPVPPPEATTQEPVAEVATPVATAPRLPIWSPRLTAWMARAVGGIGWLISAGMILVGLGLTLGTVLAPPAPAPALQLGGRGAEVRELVARHLENLHTGPILVVSGVVEPRRGGPAGLQVQLLDADGQPLPGAQAWAGPALADRALRELDPARLREDQREQSDDLRAGGAFDAVFSSVPAEARGVVLVPAALSRAVGAIDPVVTGLPRPRSPSPSPE